MKSKETTSRGKKLVPIAIGIDIVHENAAGIVPIAIGIGVYSEDLVSLRKWLQERKVTTVAMESTGNYWQSR